MRLALFSGIQETLGHHKAYTVFLCLRFVYDNTAPISILHRETNSLYPLFYSIFRFTEFLDPFQRVIQPEEIWLYKNPLVQSDNIPTRLMFVSKMLHSIVFLGSSTYYLQPFYISFNKYYSLLFLVASNL